MKSILEAKLCISEPAWWRNTGPFRWKELSDRNLSLLKLDFNKKYKTKVVRNTFKCRSSEEMFR
jgi:hypothetical protein